jgi:hypothetical protein
VGAALATLSGLVLAGGLAAGCSGSGPQPPHQSGLAALSPQQILAKADAAAKTAGSLHFSSTTRQGPTSIDFNDDSDPGGGRQDVTMSDGGQMTVLLISGIGYVNGNAAALSGFLGLTDAVSAQLAGHWISFSPGSPGYQQVADGVTTSSVLREIAPASPLTKTARQTVDGQAVVGVRGPAPASDQMPKGSKITLYVAADGRPLPVSCVEGTGSNLTTLTLSHWGEPVSVAPPQNPIPVPVQSTPPQAPGVA